MLLRSKLTLCLVVSLGIAMGTKAALATEVSPNYGDYGIIYNSVRDDKVFNSLADEAVREFEANHRVAVRSRVAATVAESVRAIRDMADRGVGTIVLVGYNHVEALRQVATDYPLVRFTQIDGRFDAPNVRSVEFREEEAGYLVGVAAALVSKSGKLSFIGGMPIPPVLRFGCGFFQGARSQKPEIIVTSVYLTRHGEGFRNAGRARSEAMTQVAEGADVIFPAAGIASLAALDATIAAGRVGIGVDSNQNGRHPGQILTSAIKRVNIAVSRALADSKSAAWKPGAISVGLSEDAVGWAVDDNNRTLVAPYVNAVEAAKAAIVSGSVTISPYDQVAECKADVN